MNRISELLDDGMKHAGVPTDYQLAKALGISKQKISALRKGTIKPDAYTCAKLAQITGRDTLEVIARIEEDTEKSDERRDFWHRLRLSLEKTQPNLVFMLMAPTLLEPINKAVICILCKIHPAPYGALNKAP